METYGGMKEGNERSKTERQKEIRDNGMNEKEKSYKYRENKIEKGGRSERGSDMTRVGEN